MSSKKLLVLALAIAFIAVPLSISFTADNSDAELDLRFDSSKTDIGSFGEMSSGTITFTLVNSTDHEITFTAYATIFGSTSKLATITDGKVPAKVDDTNGTTTASLTFQISEEGRHHVQIFVVYGDPAVTITEGPLEINVASSIWNDTTTYIAIIVVIIIIAIAAFLKMRSNPTRKNNTKTFTQMDAERKAGKSAAQSGGSASTERQTYLESKKKDAPERKSKK